jgi:hypothetical protein
MAVVVSKGGMELMQSPARVHRITYMQVWDFG